jgi:hypothetical protein
LEKEKLDYETYLKERSILIDAERESARSFDKFILTLSAGSFGLSLTFITKIVLYFNRWTIWLLAVAWISFVVSILSTLISFLTSQAGCRRQRDILDKIFKDKIATDQEINKPAQWTEWLNIVSIIFFVIGAIFLIIFSITNVCEGGCKMGENDKTSVKGCNLQHGFRAQKAPEMTDLKEGFVAQRLPASNTENKGGANPSKQTGFVPPKPPRIPGQEEKK